MKELDLSTKTLFLFDLDGVFYRGKERPVKIGGSRVVQAIRSKGKRLYILTNNSTDTVRKLQGNLSKLGIPVRQDEILTSSRLTAEYLEGRFGSASYFLVGEEGFDRELRRLGHRPVRGPEANVVVVGLDRQITYEKLDQAAKAVRRGATLVASHAATFYMSAHGPALGPGPVVRALESVTGKHAVVVGKPSPLMFTIALRKAGCAAEQAVMVGDQLDTDIEGATLAGIDSILVLTGVDRSAAGTGALGTVANVDDLTRYM
jgi:HAD superfamily hydrolase (TIGR01450 family)